MIRLIGTAVAIASLVASLSQAQASDVNRQIYISKSDQTLRLYEDGALVNAMRISTGKVKHETPSGIFSIIEKKKYHESNIYSNAPMPFMQRVTWSGVALHEGRVPNYPASHGCIRIPKKWAPELYRLTNRGTPVIITNEPVKPFRLSHSLLPGKPTQLDAPLISNAVLRGDLQQGPIEFAVLDSTITNSITPIAESSQRAAEPLKLLITWRSERDKVALTQKRLSSLGFDAGKADGLIGVQTGIALSAFNRWKNIDPKAQLMSQSVQEALKAASFESDLTNGTLEIRKAFQPLDKFDVDIDDSDMELGTHYLQAIAAPSGKAVSEWMAVSLPNQLPTGTRKRLGLRDSTNQPVQRLSDVLSRLTLSKSARDFLEENFSTQMSLTITDYSHEQETGQGTEFITITRD
jgi:hypothetical protein